MKKTEFLAALDKLGFAESDLDSDKGVSAFARWLPCGLRTAQGYAGGTSPVPPGVAKLLRFMVKRKIAPADVE